MARRHLVGGCLPLSAQVRQVFGGGDGPGAHRRQPAVITVDTLLAAFWMVASCLFAALVLVPRDLSTFPAIFMASSMTLLFGNFQHHLCHVVQIVQRQAQEVVHAAMQSER